MVSLYADMSDIFSGWGSDETPQKTPNVTSLVFLLPISVKLNERSRKHQSFLAVKSSNEICHGTSQTVTANKRTHVSLGVLPVAYFKIKLTKVSGHYVIFVVAAALVLYILSITLAAERNNKNHPKNGPNQIIDQNPYTLQILGVVDVCLMLS